MKSGDRQRLDGDEQAIGARVSSILKTTLRLSMSLIFAAIGNSIAQEPRTWIGPRIDSINTLEGGNLLDVVNQIRQEISEDKDSPIAVRIDVTDDELRRVPTTLALKKIPAVVALSYVAEVGSFEFIFENGVWVIQNTPYDERLYPSDIVTLSCQLATKEELTAMGLVESKGGMISVKNGSRWPKEEWGVMKRVDDGVLIHAFLHEIDSFRALLQLYRRGYRIPKINSNQAAPSLKPETEGKEDDQPESKRKSG